MRLLAEAARASSRDRKQQTSRPHQGFAGLSAALAVRPMSPSRTRSPNMSRRRRQVRTIDRSTTTPDRGRRRADTKYSLESFRRVLDVKWSGSSSA